MTPNETLYNTIALPIDATLGVISILLSTLIIVIYILNKGYRKPTPLIFMNIAFVDAINSINSIFMCYLLVNPKSKGVGHAAFFIQSLVLTTSLLFTLLLSILRLVALLLPFDYSRIVERWMVVGACGAIWCVALVDCYLKNDTKIYGTYDFYATGVVLRILMIVTTNIISVITLVILKRMEARDVKITKTTRSSTVTAALLSFCYLTCHSFYLYVLIVWMIRGLCKNQSNVWLEFTACGGLVYLWDISHCSFNLFSQILSF